MQTHFFALILAALSLVASAVPALADDSAPEYKVIDPETASKMIDEDADIVVLDIRTPEEYAEGHIDGSVNIDFKSKDFAEQLGPISRDTPYIVHCRSGARSAASLATFRKLGFRNIYHLDVGMNGWIDAGLPVRKPLKK